MRRLATLLIAGAIPAAGCAPVGPPPPSLLPRVTEGIDPRLPVVPTISPRPVDPALTARLAELIRQAEAGNSQFRDRMAEAERLAAGAGAPQGESWIAAQEALSAASAARIGTTKALADIDALGASALQNKGTIAPADLSAIQASASQVGEMDRTQAVRIAAVSRRLGI